MKSDKMLGEVQDVAGYLWERGWCERNGGNISVLLDDGITGSDSDTFVAIDVPAAAAGRSFFITQTGGRLRELQNQGNRVGAIIQFNEEATGYYVRQSNHPAFQATSELISHVMVHVDLAQRGSSHRVILHCHPHELIALSHHPELGRNEDAFNTACLSMLPEVRAFVPQGMALVPYALSGSLELADLTVAAFRERDVVVWSRHGALACGSTVHEAFDYIDVANKGAKIYLQCLASGFTPRGLSADEMDELEQVFSLPAYLK